MLVVASAVAPDTVLLVISAFQKAIKVNAKTTNRQPTRNLSPRFLSVSTERDLYFHQAWEPLLVR